MRYQSMFGVVLLVGALEAGPALGQEITRDEVDTVMGSCQRQREAMIAPMREEAVNSCVNLDELDRQTCERRNRDYGQRNSRSSNEAIGWDLPACKRAEGAQQYFEENPDSQSYAY